MNRTLILNSFCRIRVRLILQFWFNFQFKRFLDLKLRFFMQYCFWYSFLIGLYCLKLSDGRINYLSDISLIFNWILALLCLTNKLIFFFRFALLCGFISINYAFIRIWCIINVFRLKNVLVLESADWVNSLKVSNIAFKRQFVFMSH